jgi:hypothetical protein
MINLLPLETKKALHTDYWHRVYIVLFFFLAGALATLLLFLGLIYFLLSQDTVTSSIESTNEKAVTLEELEKELKESRTALALFTPKEQGYLPTALFNELTQKGETFFGVYITEFLYTENKKASTVALSGNAKTRDALVSFLEHLRKKNIVESVDSPISNLSKSTDIPFKATVYLKPYGGT